MIIKILLLYFSEMIEAVGHEFMEDFFGSCESVLAENGIFVQQVGRKLLIVLLTLTLMSLVLTLNLIL